MAKLYSAEAYEGAILSLVNAENIAVYCGAGVSNSRTGLVWNQLILDVAQHLKDELVDTILTPQQYAALLTRIRRNSASPIQNASIVSELIYEICDRASSGMMSSRDRMSQLLSRSLYSLSSRNTPQARRKRKESSDHILSSALYSNPTSLLRFVSMLAAFALERGRRISIITTNYDTFLEEPLRSALSWKKKSDRLWIVSSCPEEEHDAIPESALCLYYLHGRVPTKYDVRNNPNGEPILNGSVVFSEEDYAVKESSTEHLLSRALEGADCLLILGSSMEDRPLVRWLKSENSSHGDEKTNSCDVVLIQSLDPEDPSEARVEDAQRADIVSLNTWVYRHLGIDYYIPVRYFAAASFFVRDTIAALAVSEPNGDNAKLFERTSKDLSEWCKQASKRLSAKKRLKRIHLILNSYSGIILKHISAILNSDSDIAIRVEFWLKGLTPHAGDEDCLVRVGDSSSIQLSMDSRRHESFNRRFPSRTAALRSLQFGRIELVSLRRLGIIQNASRWQAFFTFPIFCQMGESHVQLPVDVGAIVVAIRLREPSNLQSFTREEVRSRFQEHVDDIGPIPVFKTRLVKLRFVIMELTKKLLSEF